MATLYEESHRTQLKEYLETRLQAISDTDPPMLAEYTLALLSHDPNTEDVRELCIESLADFVREDAIDGFVNELFDALATKSYLGSKRRADLIETPDSGAFERNKASREANGNRNITPSSVHNGPPISGKGRGRPERSAKRCFDYDRKGYCTRGDKCRYSHGNDSIITDGFSSAAQSAPPIPFLPVQPGTHAPKFARQKRSRQQFSAIANHDPDNKSLVVENVPDEYLSEDAIKTYFNQFGDLENVELNSSKHLAVISYGSNDTATKAWKDPAPIFNNRFVKVYWYDPDEQKRKPTFTHERRKKKETDEEMVDIEDVKRKSAIAQQEYEERQRKKLEHTQKLSELNEQKARLLEMQAQETKSLMEKLAQSRGNGIMSAPVVEESPEKAAIRMHLAALEEEAKILGVQISENGSNSFSTRGRGAGRAIARARGRLRGTGFTRPTFNQFSLDRRPKKVLVSDIPEGQEEQFSLFLLGNGGYDSVEDSADKPGAKVVSFKDRKTAEIFVHRAKDIPNLGHVTTSWIQEASASNGTANEDISMNGDDDNEISDDRWRK